MWAAWMSPSTWGFRVSRPPFSFDLIECGVPWQPTCMPAGIGLDMRHSTASLPVSTLQQQFGSFAHCWPNSSLLHVQRNLRGYGNEVFLRFGWKLPYGSSKG